MGRLVAILLCVGAYALTMELTGYKIEFYDHLETIRPNEGFAACKDVIGQVIFYYKIKIVIKDELTGEWVESDNWYDAQFYAPFNKEGGDGNLNGYRFIIWRWLDGNRDSVTLAPSILFDQSPAGKLHLWVRNGNLYILPDTTMKHDKVKRL